MNFEALKDLERHLVLQNITLNPQYYKRPPETLLFGGTVLAGYGGHLFVVGGSNQWEQQLLGEYQLPEADLNHWKSILLERTIKARELGIKLAQLVVPEKQLALPTFRWKIDTIPDFSNRPLSHLMKALSPEVKLIYPADKFKAEQSTAELFWRGNSHWCASGCILAVLSVLHSLLDDDDMKSDRILMERAMMGHDLAFHYTDQTFEEVIRIQESGTRIFDNMAFKISGHYGGSHYVISNPDAPVKETLIIFGDSYSCDMGLAAAMSAFFCEVHFLWAKDVNWPYIVDKKAKYVLWESAERFLIIPPGGS